MRSGVVLQGSGRVTVINPRGCYACTVHVVLRWNCRKLYLLRLLRYGEGNSRHLWALHDSGSPLQVWREVLRLLLDLHHIHRNVGTPLWRRHVLMLHSNALLLLWLPLVTAGDHADVLLRRGHHHSVALRNEPSLDDYARRLHPVRGRHHLSLRGSIPHKTLLLRLLLLLHDVVLLHHPLRRHDTRLLHHDLLLTLNHHGAMLTCRGVRHHASGWALLSHNALHSHVTTLRINHLCIVDSDVSVPLLRLQRKKKPNICITVVYWILLTTTLVTTSTRLKGQFFSLCRACNETHFYQLQTKLGEGNVFTRLCPFKGRGLRVTIPLKGHTPAPSSAYPPGPYPPQGSYLLPRPYNLRMVINKFESCYMSCTMVVCPWSVLYLTKLDVDLAVKGLSSVTDRLR